MGPPTLSFLLIFLPVKVLSRVFRGKFLAGRKRLHRRNSFVGTSCGCGILTSLIHLKGKKTRVDQATHNKIVSLIWDNTLMKERIAPLCPYATIRFPSLVPGQKTGARLTVRKPRMSPRNQA
jgi:hypothetical protein